MEECGNCMIHSRGFSRKTVLVTGASGDIGRGIALAFGALGYKVAAHYRTRQDSAKETAAVIRENGGEAAAFYADLRREDEVERMFSQIEHALGPVDVLVNNAGAAYQGLLTDMTLSDWQWILDANLTSAFLCCRRALPSMIRQKEGAIVNIGSIWGRQGASCEAAYSAAKAGLIGLTQALAREDGPSGIRVNCIAPGVIDTKMNSHLSPSDLLSLTDETPLARLGTVEDVAKAVVFIAQSDFITGQTLGVDGGII